MGLLINLLDDISKQQYVEKGKNYLGDYIHVDTTTKNNKNYFNQQHQQLVSYLSLRFERFFQYLKSTPKSRRLFREPRRQSYGEADRLNEEKQELYRAARYNSPREQPKTCPKRPFICVLSHFIIKDDNFII